VLVVTSEAVEGTPGGGGDLRRLCDSLGFCVVALQLTHRASPTAPSVVCTSLSEVLERDSITWQLFNEVLLFGVERAAAELVYRRAAGRAPIVRVYSRDVRVASARFPDASQTWARLLCAAAARETLKREGNAQRVQREIARVQSAPQRPWLVGLRACATALRARGQERIAQRNSPTHAVSVLRPAAVQPLSRMRNTAFFCADSFVQENPTLIAHLQESFGIRCIRRQLNSVASLILDERTCVLVVDGAEGSSWASNTGEASQLLEHLAMQYALVYVLFCWPLQKDPLYPEVAAIW
jgi:hypothetical protein